MINSTVRLICARRSNVTSLVEEYEFISRNEATKSNDDDNGDDEGDDNNERRDNASRGSWAELSLIKFIRKSCGVIVTNRNVQRFLTFMIIINATTMGIQTYPIIRNDPTLSFVFDAIDTTFLVMFTIELILQLIFRGFRLFTDGWLVMDFVVVTISWAVSQLQIARSLRIFRTIRLISRYKAMRDIVGAVSTVITEIFLIFSLILLCFYVYAVLCTTLFKEMYRDGLLSSDYFSSLGKTTFTLFQVICNDDWSQIVREVMETYPYSSYVFILFLLHMSFVLLNMFIAIFVQSIYSMKGNGYVNDDNVQQPEERVTGSRTVREITLNIEAATQSMQTMAESQKRATEKIYKLANQIELQKRNQSMHYG